jgi:hypothetical protein
MAMPSRSRRLKKLTQQQSHVDDQAEKRKSSADVDRSLKLAGFEVVALA